MKPAAFRWATALVAAWISAGSWTGPVFASGFALFDQSASGAGNAFSGAGALVEDASVIYWNPAGISRLPAGTQFVAAGHYIRSSIKFREGGSTAGVNRTDFGNTGGNAGSGALVPNGYFTMDLSQRMKFGLGVNVPFGLKTEYDPAWVGRFQGINTEIRTLNINPAIAWRAGDGAAFGFGLNHQTGKVSLLTGVNYKGLVAGTALDAAVAPNAEGQNKTELDGDAWGYDFGALFDVAPGARVGLAYRSSLKYHLAGTTSFSNVPGAFALSPELAAATAAGDVNLSVKTPDSLSVSVAHQVNRQWTLLADATWTGWSKIQSLPLVRDNGARVTTFTFSFEDTMRYSAGANYRLSDAWMLKSGITLDQSPVPSAEARTVRLPDSDRRVFAFGAKYRTSASGAIDFAYTYVKFKVTPINNIQNNTAAGQMNGNVIGSYKVGAYVAGVQYAHSF